MNTLPRTITVHFLSDSDTYQQLRCHWGKLMRSERKHELTAAHHLLYLALLGKDWRKGFGCITNQRKLDNGAFQGWMLFRATGILSMRSQENALLAPFDGLVTPAMLQHIRQLVPAKYPYQYSPDQFTATNYPFDAYYQPIASDEGANA